MKFNNIFKKLMNNVPNIRIKDCEWDVQRDICQESFNYNPLIINYLLFEAIDQLDLAPIPKEILNHIC